MSAVDLAPDRTGMQSGCPLVAAPSPPHPRDSRLDRRTNGSCQEMRVTATDWPLRCGSGCEAGNVDLRDCDSVEGTRQLRANVPVRLVAYVAPPLTATDVGACDVARRRDQRGRVDSEGEPAVQIRRGLRRIGRVPVDIAVRVEPGERAAVLRSDRQLSTEAVEVRRAVEADVAEGPTGHDGAVVG